MNSSLFTGPNENMQRLTSQNKIIPMLPQHGRRYVWMCAQFRAKVVFQHIQITMVICSLASLVCASGFSLPQCPSLNPQAYLIVYWCAIVAFISVVLAFIGMQCCDTVHRRGSRLCKYPFPPVILLLPSYMVQIGLIVFFGMWTVEQVLEEYYRLRKSNKIQGFMVQLVFSSVIPWLIVWVTVFYVLVVSFDYAFYASRKSRYWRQPVPQPVILTGCNYSLAVSEPSQKNHSPCFCKDMKEFDRLSSLSSRSAATMRSCPSQLMADLPSPILPSNENSSVIKDCIQMLNLHVSPVRRQLDTVYEETKSQESDE